MDNYYSSKLEQELFLNFESQLVCCLETGDNENKWDSHNDT